MTTPDATSFQVRAELEDLLERDLLGPWDGPEEELPPGTSPAERYMLGRLVPRQQPEEPADDEQLEPELVDREVASPASGDDGEEEGAEADATVRSGSMSASAIGLAFSVPATVDVISVTAKWGRYERSPSETHETPTGRAAITWHRVPAGGSVEVRTDAEGSDSLVPDDEQPGVVVRYTVRHRGARRVVELALVNGQRTPAKTQDTARLYQVGLTVTALDGNAAIFCGHNDPDVASSRCRGLTTSGCTWSCCTGRRACTRTGGSARSMLPCVMARRGRGSCPRRASRRRRCGSWCRGRCQVWCSTWRGSGRRSWGAMTWCGRCGRW